MIGRAPFGVAALLALAACRHTPPARPEIEDGEQLHVVARGETALAIAARYGVTLEDLAARNDLDDPNKLAAGQTLAIPPRRSAAPAPDPDAPWTDADEPPKIDPPRNDAAPVAWSEAAGSGEWIWPVDGVVVSAFGQREGAQHEGVDIGAPAGTVVWAAAGGTVLFAGEKPGYGKLVIVSHGAELVTIYARNDQNLVESGQQVRQGQPIARVGTSGDATSPALHFEIRDGRQPINPMSRLPR